MKWLKAFANLFIDAGIKFSDDNCPRYAAALSYYTVFSLAPLLIITVALLSLYFGGDVDARIQLIKSIEEVTGPQISKIIGDLIVSATRPIQGTFASIFAILLFLIGASRILVELRVVLNTIWGFAQKKPPQPLGFLKLASQVILVRLFTILMLLVIGVSILALMLISVYFSAVNSWLAANTPEAFPISRILDPLFTIGGLTGFFYLIMLILPAHRPPRHSVLFGAFIAAVLFNLGKTVIGIYLARAVASSAYGAASSLVVLMLWIYISSCIFLYGAQLAASIQLRRLKREKQELSDQLAARQEKKKQAQIQPAEAVDTVEAVEAVEAANITDAGQEVGLPQKEGKTKKSKQPKKSAQRTKVAQENQTSKN